MDSNRLITIEITMLRISLTVLMISLLLSCLPNGDMERFSAWETEIAPLTKKEKQFADSLKTAGFETTIEHYFVGRQYSPTYDVSIVIDTNINKFTTCFELQYKLKELLNNLYTHVIADSILYDTENFKFNLSGGSLIKDTLCGRKYGVYYFPKRNVAKWNRFKVVKAKDQYYRQRI